MFLNQPVFPQSAVESSLAQKEMIENRNLNIITDAVCGWYRYNIRFALPVYDDKTGKVARHNIYSASMLVRHANDGRKYLYDILAIKKETSSPLK